MEYLMIILTLFLHSENILGYSGNTLGILFWNFRNSSRIFQEYLALAGCTLKK